MTTYFISRHAGALDWAKEQGYAVDQQLAHFDVNCIKAGDTVLGTLPINLVAELNAKGGYYYHLTLELPASVRGTEISAEAMRIYGARLEAYSAKKL